MLSPFSIKKLLYPSLSHTQRHTIYKNILYVIYKKAAAWRMEGLYGHRSTSGYYGVSPENLLIPTTEYENLISSQQRFPVYGSDELFSAASVISEAASITRDHHHHHQGVDDPTLIKAKIISHPSYPKLLHAYIDCQKVGAPPEIASMLDEIRRGSDVYNRHDAVSTSLIGADPELDEFMETYCHILIKYKSDLSRPFDEASSFLNNIEAELGDLIKDENVVSSDEEFGAIEMDVEGRETRSEDQELKNKLLRKFGSHISSLKLEFSKKKKKGKLPKEARQALLEWWNVHYKWPYPTEADKIYLAESTGLDQKQINNWFINQRKRHWKPSEDMQLAVMDSLSEQFYGTHD